MAADKENTKAVGRARQEAPQKKEKVLAIAKRKNLPIAKTIRH